MDRPTLNAAVIEGQKSVADVNKTLVDLMKHITTLSAGIIVVIATFADKFADANKFTWALPWAVICLLCAILYALKICVVGTMLNIHLSAVTTAILLIQSDTELKSKVEAIQQPVKLLERSKNFGIYAVDLLFFAGVVLLSLFVLTNLPRHASHSTSPPNSVPASFSGPVAPSTGPSTAPAQPHAASPADRHNHP
jgi:hypothetical protein